MALKPIDSTHIHIPPSVGGDCLPENSTLSSGCSCIVIITYNKDKSVRTTPDGYSGWLLRTTPDGYASHRGSQCPPKGQPGLGETTYQTSCLPCAGSFYLYDCRIRAGFPYISRRGLRPMLVCGLRSQATQP